MSDATAILGWRTCLLCSNLVINEVAARTGGICSECFAGGHGPNTIRIEVVGRGFRVRVPRRRPRSRRPSDKHPDHHKAERAKTNALKRLKAIFPDLYDTLVAEERAKMGLHPWPTHMAVRYGWDPDCSKTLEFAEVYHAISHEPRHLPTPVADP